MRGLALLLLAFLAAAPARAQSTEAPVMGTSSDAGTAEEAQPQTTRILVIGDAIGGGLGAGLTRVAEARGDYEVALRFNEESGLARPEVYDWVATVPKVLESSEYDVIVVLVGANDRQTIRSGNMRYAFNSEGWVAAYRAQVDQLLDELSASGARVFWVGLPPMADPDYDAAMQAITALQRERVEARGMTFIDMRPVLTADGGSYTDTGPDDTGTVTKLRGRDGISFFKAGNNLMGAQVLAAIESGPAASPEQGTAPVAASQGAEPAEETSPVPLFGQVLMNGEVYTAAPEGVTANAVILAGGGLSSEAALRTLRDVAPEGSAAARLFRQGDAGRAPAGRADDFSLPPPPP
ncbi:GDSL-type esterase/lipase family protein [Aestuariivirga sp.]|uniref:SGNH/GDSL hydrolase family protein n=1 Tax=Aestuariivirga sp. TaxID=2650926 RepID=UPI00391B67EB